MPDAPPDIQNRDPILIVEDSDIDFRRIKRAFEHLRFVNPIYRCINGDEAIDFLHHRNAYDNPEASPRPSLIMLDLRYDSSNSSRKYPSTGIDGYAVLARIKSDEELRGIPVIVFTSSDSPSDVEICYLKGANTYLSKPFEYTDLIEAIRRLDQFWFHVALLPQNKSGSWSGEHFLKPPV